MKSKKKQTVTIAMVTALGMNCVIQPISIYAQEKEETKSEELVDTTESKEVVLPTGSITYPQHVKGTVDQSLQEILLPNGWTWIDPTMKIQAGITAYPARVEVQDDIYDYRNEPGYHPQGYYVETVLAVEVEESGMSAQGMQAIRPLASSQATKLQGIDINEQSFPDPAFREWVIHHIAGADDKNLSTVDIANVTAIDVSKMTTIQSLEGIEHFTFLENLKCQNTSIQSLDVRMMEHLVYLNCSENLLLNKIFIDGAANLKSLYVSKTGLEELVIQNSPALRFLECSENLNMKKLEVAGAGALEELNCKKTGISSLNLSKNILLTDLNCSENMSLRELILEGAIGLEEIFCSDSAIEALIIQDHPNLVSIDCNDTANLKILDVSGAEALETLNSVNTGLEELNVSNNRNLVELDCSDSVHLTKLTVTGADALELLTCYNTAIQELDISQNKNLLLLDGSENSSLTRVNLAGADALEEVDCSFSGIQELDVSENKNLTMLDCRGSKALKKLVVAGAEALETLYCQETGLQHLDVSKNRNLETLSCEDAPLASLIVDNTLQTFKKTESNVEIQITAHSFPLHSILPDVNISNIENLTNAEFQKNSDILTIKDTTKPITYDYKCGTLNGANEFLQVYLHLKKNTSSITIQNDAKMTYTGKAFVPAIQVNGEGVITYAYEKEEKGGWVPYPKAPIDTGHYRVLVNLEGNEFYEDTSAQKEFYIVKAIPSYTIPTDFTITYGQALQDIVLPEGFSWKDASFVIGDAGTYDVMLTYTPKDTENYSIVENVRVNVIVKQAQNHWINTVNINDWVVGENAKIAKASAAFGDVEFMYSTSKDGIYTTKVPIEAGNYVVRATVAETKNYTGLESYANFTISDKKLPEEEKVLEEVKEEKQDVIKETGKDMAGFKGIWGILFTYTIGVFIKERRKTIKN